MHANAARTIQPTAPPTLRVHEDPTHEGPVARSVVEGLHSVVTPTVAKVILESALALSGRSLVPEDAAEASEFIGGPLLTSLRTTIDGDGAQAFMNRMEPILSLASLSGCGSHVRLKAPTAEGPLVVFASLDRHLGNQVRDALAGRATVETATNVLDLLLRIDRTAAEDEIAIVVDGAAPPIETVALASMLPDRDTLKVILWRVEREKRADIDASRPDDQSWLAFGENAPIADVIDLLRSHL